MTRRNVRLLLASALVTALGCADDANPHGVPTGLGSGGASSLATGSAGGAVGSTATSTSGAGGTMASSVTAASTVAASSTGAAMEPNFDAIPWETDGDVGFGVARKDTQNPLGTNAFIGYAGYNVNRDQACAWVTALYHATLRDRGVRFVYCVQGPADPSYTQLEIGNSKIAKKLVTEVDATTTFVLVAAHSSGSFVAHELFDQLATGLDPSDVTADKVVYFDLDGGQSGLTNASVARLRRAYFVSAHDPKTQSSAPNRGTMQLLGQTYPNKGGFLDLDATQAGCNAGAKWCLHMVPILAKPHNPNDATAALDYTDFIGRPVTTTYIDVKASEAGLQP